LSRKSPTGKSGKRRPELIRYLRWQFVGEGARPCPRALLRVSCPRPETASRRRRSIVRPQYRKTKRRNTARITHQTGWLQVSETAGRSHSCYWGELSRARKLSSATVAQSCNTTLRSELLISRPSLLSMKPSFLNLFIKRFTRERVVPIISASVSWEILGRIFWGSSFLP